MFIESEFFSDRRLRVRLDGKVRVSVDVILRVAPKVTF